MHGLAAPTTMLSRQRLEPTVGDNGWRADAEETTGTVVHGCSGCDDLLPLPPSSCELSTNISCLKSQFWAPNDAEHAPRASPTTGSSPASAVAPFANKHNTAALSVVLVALLIDFLVHPLVGSRFLLCPRARAPSVGVFSLGRSGRASAGVPLFADLYYLPECRR
jgi:hypothetical protein